MVGGRGDIREEGKERGREGKRTGRKGGERERMVGGRGDIWGEGKEEERSKRRDSVVYVLGMSFSEILSHLFQSGLPLLCPVPLTGLPLLPAGCVGERRSGLAMEADTVLTSASSSCL